MLDILKMSLLSSVTSVIFFQPSPSMMSMLLKGPKRDPEICLAISQGLFLTGIFLLLEYSECAV